MQGRCRGGGGEVIAPPFPTVLKQYRDHIKWYVVMLRCKGPGQHMPIVEHLTIFHFCMVIYDPGQECEEPCHGL
jgi:hypothetical protein